MFNIIDKKLLIFYSNQILRQFAFGFTSIFGVVFVYQLFDDSIFAALCTFGLIYVFPLILAPLVAKMHDYTSKSAMMITGSCFTILAFLSFMFLQDYPLYLAAAYVISSGLATVLFWPSYHLTFSEITHDNKRGGEIATLQIIANIMTISSPIIAGFIVVNYGFTILFITSLFIFIFSIIPLLLVKSHFNTHFEYKYEESYKRLFKKENRNLLIAHTSNGVQNIVQVLFWPLFIFIALNGRYSDIGIISGLAIFVTIIIRYFVGKLLDNKKTMNSTLNITSELTSFSWIFRFFAFNPFTVFLSDTFFKVTNGIQAMSFTKIYYDHTSIEFNHADEYVVLRDLALNIGRLLMIIVGGAIAILFGIKYTFLIAAIAMILMERIETEKII
jgi:MFS family permease